MNEANGLYGGSERERKKTNRQTSFKPRRREASVESARLGSGEFRSRFSGSGTGFWFASRKLACVCMLHQMNVVNRVVRIWESGDKRVRVY